MSTHEKCQTCGGTGTVYESDGQGRNDVPAVCPACENDRCPFCGTPIADMMHAAGEVMDCVPYCPRCGETFPEWRNK